MAVQLDIRPRVTIPTDPPVRSSAGRRRWLPPLAVPAVGYWLAMGALTYGFTRLGPNPLDGAVEASAFTAVEAAPPDAARPSPDASPAPAPAPVPAPEATLPLAPSPPASEPEADEARPRARPEDLAASNSRREQRSGADEPRLSSERRSEPPAREEPRVALSFPQFTDSSRPRAAEHAADGPRIDSLFEQAGDAPSKAPAVAAPPPPEREPAASVASSCEAAIARNSEELTIGGERGPADISREAYASILQNGRYLAGCAIPDRTVFEICAAVKDGRAVGVTIVSSPSSPTLNACVRRAVAGLQFPRNPRLDVTHTRFDAVKR